MLHAVVRPDGICRFSAPSSGPCSLCMPTHFSLVLRQALSIRRQAEASLACMMSLQEPKAAQWQQTGLHSITTCPASPASMCMTTSQSNGPHSIPRMQPLASMRSLQPCMTCCCSVQPSVSQKSVHSRSYLSQAVLLLVVGHM